MDKIKEMEMLRIYVSQDQKYEGSLLYKVIVQEAHKRGLAGAMVSKGIMGFGRDGRISSSQLLVLNENLPYVIEIIDEHEKIAEFLTDLDKMVTEGFVTLDKVNVIIDR